MLDFSKILLPLDLEEPSLPAVHQAAALAHHFHSQVVLLHVVRRLSYLGIHQMLHGDLLTEGIKQAEAKLDAHIVPEFAGLAVSRIVAKGDPGQVVVQIAQDENAKLIVLGAHGHGALASMLIGATSSKVLDGAHCPVWTGAHLPAKVAGLNIRRVLCAIELTHRDKATAQLAAALASAVGAQLTLAHVTPSVEIYGPGGMHAAPDFKESVVSASNTHMSKLREELGVQADLYVGSGSVSKILQQAVKETGADLLVIGRRISINRLGANSFAIIRESPVPVLSV